MTPVVFHIPVCPFSQRLEVLLTLKGMHDRVQFSCVDITKPRDPALLAKTGGTTALPVLEPDKYGVSASDAALGLVLSEFTRARRPPGRGLPCR